MLIRFTGNRDRFETVVIYLSYISNRSVVVATVNAAVLHVLCTGQVVIEIDDFMNNIRRGFSATVTNGWSRNDLRVV